MIMYDLIKHTSAAVQATPALAILGCGPYYATDFFDREGRVVLVFWIVDNQGNVAKVWEHTLSVLPVEASGAVRLMNEPA